ncbi:peptidylprolyl isomerase [Candidatus Thorarchaeota archaeon]|jgi:FKBP-type peptidyl-prolyl cis-trans isomerase 2|nr:MAG: peptidylprolyl isomerase [Candidatus Thorarchaeota archaeon]
MSKKKTTKKAAKKKASSKPAKKKKTTKKKAATEPVVGDSSVLYIDYTAKIKDDDVVFDTTIEEVAQAEGVYKENERYEPMLVAIGWNWLLAAVEEELIGLKAGDKKTVVVPPEKGAGKRDPKKIKMIAKTKLAKQGARPIKGEEITFGDERGVITSVFGRTVRVDFNSPLADKTLVFDVTVKEILPDEKEKLQAIVKRRVPGLPQDDFKVSISKKVITIEMPKETRYVQNIQYAEIGIAADALKVVPSAKEVRLVVTFERPEEPPNVT